MILQHTRISIGRTWRFVTGAGISSVACDLTGYRRRIDELKGTSVVADFGLPWPPYRSRFWTHMVNGTYQDRQSRALVASLLPLRQHGALPAVPGCTGKVEFEALLHPFAITTIVHLQLEPITPWPSAAEASALLHGILESPLVGGAQVRDGLLLDQLRGLPQSDAGQEQARFEEAGQFVFLSAVHEAVTDPGALAYAMASLFDDEREDAAHPLRSHGGAVCLDHDTVGLVLPHTLPRAGQRLGCLHHNLTTLLGYLGNLATLTTAASTTVAGQWFQSQAATLLNYLYRRSPLPDTGSIYKSRLPQLWIDEHHLARSVNALTVPGLPPLPVPL